MAVWSVGPTDTLGGRQVYVQESGAPGRPAIVFVHGGGPNGRMWRGHLDRLAARFHCLAPDLPGFGLSHDLTSLSLAETADLLAGLIEARVPTRRAHIVGLSYGGSVVFAMLDRHPGCVERAVIDGAAVLPLWGGWGDRLVQAGAIAVSPIVATGLDTSSTDRCCEVGRSSNGGRGPCLLSSGPKGP
jgi:pimeloyl-ACP methyl ester carboxylesterase